MTMHHVSIFSSLHLDLCPYEHVLQDSGQCMLSEHAFGVDRDECMMCVLKNDVKQYVPIIIMIIIMKNFHRRN